jgi:hypothetical protein
MTHSFQDETDFCQKNYVEYSIEAKTKWLRQFGLKVNQAKTDACLFFKHNVAPIMIRVDDAFTSSKRQ